MSMHLVSHDFTNWSPTEEVFSNQQLLPLIFHSMTPCEVFQFSCVSKNAQDILNRCYGYKARENFFSLFNPGLELSKLGREFKIYLNSCGVDEEKHIIDCVTKFFRSVPLEEDLEFRCHFSVKDEWDPFPKACSTIYLVRDVLIGGKKRKAPPNIIQPSESPTGLVNYCPSKTRKAECLYSVEVTGLQMARVEGKIFEAMQQRVDEANDFLVKQEERGSSTLTKQEENDSCTLF
jgi:hypothetical protein